MSLPIACTLTDTEFQARRHTVLQRVRNEVTEVRELIDGFEYGFAPGVDRLEQLSALVDSSASVAPSCNFKSQWNGMVVQSGWQ